MAKEKTPFFSLGARGTVGGVITAQKLKGSTLIRSKPTPTDPYTLAQAYHRWDYQDAVALWNDFTNSQKRAYAIAGSRKHMTALAVWIQEYLKGLPYIAGRWHLDERSGALAIDASGKGNNGVVIGAQHWPAFFDYGLKSDGVNDRVDVPASASLVSPYEATFECLCLFEALTDWDYIMVQGNTPDPTNNLVLGLTGAPHKIRFKVANDQTAISLNPVLTDTVYHLAGRITTAKVMTVFVNGVPGVPVNNNVACDAKGALTLFIDWTLAPALFLKAILDHVTYYNFALSNSLILAHSKRRYP